MRAARERSRLSSSRELRFAARRSLPTRVNSSSEREYNGQRRRGWRAGLVALALVLGAATAAGGGVDKVTPDFAALARKAAVTLPPPPPWLPTAAESNWTLDDVQAELKKFTDTPPRVNMLRTRLVRPDRRWLKDFKDWFHSVQKPLKIHYTEQLWDCDDYANCFVAFADLLGLKAGEKHASGLCVGWASVYYQVAYGGIRAGGAHALVVVGTSEGIYLLDPQDGSMVALKDFPNRDTIEEINF